MLPMTFYLGNRAFILFKAWHPMTDGPFVGACFGIFFLCIFHEWLTTFRITSKIIEKDAKFPALAKFFSKKLGQAILYYFSVTLSYIIMLLLMTFNGYIFIIILVALSVGFALFGKARGGVSSELCCEQHDETEDNCCDNEKINTNEDA